METTSQAVISVQETELIRRIRYLALRITESSQWLLDPGLQRHFLSGGRCSLQEMLDDREVPLVVCTTHNVLMFRTRLRENPCGLHVGLSEAQVIKCAHFTYGYMGSDRESLVEPVNDTYLNYSPSRLSPEILSDQLAALERACDAEQLCFKIVYRDSL